MKFHIITIFPEIFNSYFRESIVGRAREKGTIKIKIHDLRDWTSDRHRTVDDSPYGGGAGMIMKVEPIYKALKSIRSNVKRQMSNVILFSAKGKKWNQALAKKYSRLDSVIMICGRYEGVDERVKKFTDDEISIGDYVLTGGEIPAMAVVDSVTRLLPGVLGNAGSLMEESFNQTNLQSKISNLKSLEYPQYTRPEIFEAEGKKYRVPKILLSGNHGEIDKWRRKKMKPADKS